MKHIGNVKIIQAEERTSQRTGNKYFYCVGMSDENLPCVFFASKDDNPKVGTEYGQFLTYDRALNAIIRYQKVQ